MAKHENEVGITLISMVMVYWGITTILMKHALYYMNSTTYIMLRFTSAAILIVIVFGKSLYRQLAGGKSNKLFLHGMILGMLHIIPMECTTLAMYYTTASNSVFIGQLSFIFVPLLECVLYKKVISQGLFATIVSLLFGLAVFSDIINTGLNPGDMISVISAFFNAMGIMAIKRFAEKNSPVLLGALQVIATAIFSLVIWRIQPGEVQWCLNSVSILLYTGVIGTAAAFIVLAVGQSKTSSVNAAFLTLIQPVCGMIGACLIADEFGNVEPVTGNKIIGTIIITGALIFYLRKEKKKAADKQAL